MILRKKKNASSLASLNEPPTVCNWMISGRGLREAERKAIAPIWYNSGNSSTGTCPKLQIIPAQVYSKQHSLRNCFFGMPHYGWPLSSLPPSIRRLNMEKSGVILLRNSTRFATYGYNWLYLCSATYAVPTPPDEWPYASTLALGPGSLRVHKS